MTAEVGMKEIRVMWQRPFDKSKKEGRKDLSLLKSFVFVTEHRTSREHLKMACSI